MDTMTRFLAKLRELLRAKVKDADLTSEEFDEAVRQARSHVGGTVRWERARQDSQEGNQMNAFRLLGEIALSEDKSSGTVQIFPPVGKYSHPVYGEIDISPEFLQTVKKHFDDKAYQQDLPLTIDLEHQTKLSGAAGWIKDVDIKGDAGMFATIEFNDRGKTLVKDDGYRYFSPEFYDRWTDPASNQKFENVLIGGALTNRPFFKGMAPVVMGTEGIFAFAEMTFAAADDDGDEPKMDDMMKMMQSMMGMMGEMKMPKEMMSEMQGMMNKMKSMPKMQASEDTGPSGAAAGAASVDGSPANSNGGDPMGMTEEEARQFSEIQTSLKTLTERLATAETTAASESAARKAAEEVAKQASERVIALERDAQRKTFGEFVRENRLAFRGEVDEAVNKLEKLSKQLSAEDFTDYLEDRKAQHAQMRESVLFDQVGSSNGTPVGKGAAGEIDALVTKAMSENSQLTKAQATIKVASENPLLYDRYDKELKRLQKRGE